MQHSTTQSSLQFPAAVKKRHSLFVMSKSTDRLLTTDISERPIDRIFEVSEVQKGGCETFRYSVIQGMV